MSRQATFDSVLDASNVGQSTSTSRASPRGPSLASRARNVVDAIERDAERVVDSTKRVLTRNAIWRVVVIVLILLILSIIIFAMYRTLRRINQKEPILQRIESLFRTDKFDHPSQIQQGNVYVVDGLGLKNAVVRCCAPEKKHLTLYTMFYAPWCSACKTAEASLRALVNDAKKRNAPIVFLLVNGDKVDKKDQDKYMLEKGYPTVHLIKNGSIVHTIECDLRNVEELKKCVYERNFERVITDSNSEYSDDGQSYDSSQSSAVLI